MAKKAKSKAKVSRKDLKKSIKVRENKIAKHASKLKKLKKMLKSL